MDWMISQANAKVFSACPKCAARALKPVKAHAFFCPECEFEFYLNVAAAVVGLITDSQGRLLVTVRAGEPKIGTLDLPGGFVDPGETAEEALRREIREELNLAAGELDYFCTMPNQYLYKGVLYATMDAAYFCRAADVSPLRPMDDIAEALWLSPGDLVLEKFGFESVKKIISGYLSLRR